MNKKLTLCVIGGLAVASFAFAEDGATGTLPHAGTLPPPKEKMMQLRGERRDAIDQFRADRGEERGKLADEEQGDRDEMRVKIEDQRLKMVQNIDALHDAFRARATTTGEDRRDLIGKMRDEHADFKKTVHDMQEDFHDKIEASRQQMQENLAKNREALRTKLAAIKDERKKTIVEGLDKRFEELGTQFTGHFNEVINRLEDVLVKVKTRTDKAEQAGKDVSSVRPLIDKATTAIADARTAIAAQVGKLYPVQISTEDKLRTDVSKTRDAFRTDIQKVRDVVQAARAAVVNVVNALRSIQGVDDDSSSTTGTTSTSSATSTSSN